VTLVKVLLALFLPPVAAFLQVGLGFHFWLNLVLTFFVFFPGMVHALWLVAANKT
jgi:uncharacterized membrane protein YqaE (UPF0057 family)